MMAFPTLMLALAMISVLGGSVQNVIIVIVAVDTPRMVRLVRGQVLSLREQQFVEAAKAVGASVPRTLFVHIAPNTFGVVMVAATLYFAGAVMTEAALSYLGAGVAPYTPTWGNHHVGRTEVPPGRGVGQLLSRPLPVPDRAGDQLG